MRVGDYVSATRPYQHQEEGFRFCVKRRGRAALFWDPGTGKTKTTIDFGSFGYLSGKIRRVLVLAPLNAVGVWESEIPVHTPEYVPHAVRTLRGSTDEKRAALADLLREFAENDTLLWVVVNYQALIERTIKERVVRGKDGIDRVRPGRVIAPLWPDLRAFGFDLIVADEGHRLADPTTKQTRGVIGIAQQTPYRLLLTGSGIKNKPLDVYGQMMFVEPSVFNVSKQRYNRKTKEYDDVVAPMTWSEFRSEYSRTGTRGFWDVREYVHLDDLYSRVHGVSLVKKKEQCLDLPEKIFQKVLVDLDPSTREIYTRMEEEMVAYIRESEELKKRATSRQEIMAIARVQIAKLLRCRQIANGFVGGTIDESGGAGAEPDGVVHTLSSEKIDATLDLVADLRASGEKIVIFTVFTHDFNRIGARLDRAKIAWGGIRGGVSAKERKALVDAFQKEKKPEVLLIQIDSGAEAITLHRAHVVIFHNVSYSYDKFVQAQDRIHRIGQAKKCLYYLIVAKDTIEEDVYAKLEQKADFARAFVNHPAAVAQQMAARLKKYGRKLAS